MDQEEMNVGDVVRWASQASGVIKIKQGEIVHIAEQGQEIPKAVLADGRPQFSTTRVKERRYVVKVFPTPKSTRPFYYLPVTNNLQLVMKEAA